MRNDNVNPGSCKLNQDQGGQEFGKGLNRSPREDGGDDACEDTLGKSTHETTQVGPETTMRGQKSVDGSKRRSHCSGGAISRLGRRANSSLLIVASVAGKGFVGRRILIFNNGEDRVNVEQGVVDLQVPSRLVDMMSIFTDIDFNRGGETYQERNR